MNYILEGYNISGDEIWIDTEALKDNFGIQSYEILVNNIPKIMDVNIYCTGHTDETLKAIMKITNSEYNIDYEEEVSMEQVYKGIFEAIRDNQSMLANTRLDKMSSIAIGNALAELAVNNVIEKITYNGLYFLFKEDGTAIGTGTGFKITGKTIELMDTDFIEDEEEYTLVKYGENIVRAKIIGNAIESMEMEKCNEEDIPVEYKDLKTLEDFVTEEDYLIYRRGLLVKEKTAEDYIEDDFLDDLF